MLFNIDDICRKPSDKANCTDSFFNQKRKGWKKLNSAVARCDFAQNRWRLCSRGIMFFALWKASPLGIELSQIKKDPEMKPKFINEISDFISRILGFSNSSVYAPSSWCLITPPARRHPENNFAHAVGEGIAEKLGIGFDKKCCDIRNKGRVNADFLFNRLPDANLIVFDDIVTTGSTFSAMDRAIRPHHDPKKAIIYIAGINNKL